MTNHQRDVTGSWLKHSAIVVAIGLLTSLVLWAYRPALDVGFYLDDEHSFLESPAHHWTSVSWDNFERLLEQSYSSRRVVANLSFALNHLAGGLEPRGYHAVNVALHVLVGAVLAYLALLYVRLARARGDVVDRGALPTVLIAALPASVFLLHPLNTQAVTYVVQRMSVLAALFFLVSFCLYLKGRAAGGRNAQVVWFGGALIAWLMALGSKETAVLLPLVVAVYEWCFYRKEWYQRVTRLREKPARTQRIALGLVVGGALIVAVALYAYIGYVSIRLTEQFPLRDFSGLERMLTQPRVHVLYLTLLFWPHPDRLTLDYDFVVSRGLLDPVTTLPALIVIAALFAGAVFLARRAPILGFPLLAYFLLHLVESGPLSLELVFEHRMYLPMAMLTLICAVLLARVPRRWASVATSIVLIVCVVLAAGTHARNRLWADPIAFNQDIVRKAPGNSRAHHNLGVALYETGGYDEAIASFNRAATLEATPDLRATTHLLLGRAHLELGRYEEALAEFSAALISAPGFHPALIYTGNALKQMGREEEALEHHLRAGIEAGRAGRLHEALSHFRHAIELDAANSVAHNQLGNVYLLLDRPDEALAEYDLAVSLDDSNAEALYNLGSELERRGRWSEAEPHYRRFVAIAPAWLAAQVQDIEMRLRTNSDRR